MDHDRPFGTSKNSEKNEREKKKIEKNTKVRKNDVSLEAK